MNEYEKLKVLYDEAVSKAQTAIDSEDLESAKKYQEEARALSGKMSVVKAQFDLQTQANESPVEQVDRLPVDTGVETEDQASTASNHSKAFDAAYVTRFGDARDAIDDVAKAVHGNDYQEKRFRQVSSFNHYVRFGDKRLNAKQYGSLRELILTPETIELELRMGATADELRTIKNVQQESILELGGHLVPEDWRAELLKRIMGMTVVRSRARVVTTVRDKVEWPVLLGGDSRYTSGVRVTWTGETQDVNDLAGTGFTVGALDIPVHTVMARIDPTKNLLEDGGISISSLISELFSEAFALDEDEKFLTGIGAGTPQGILGKRSGAEEVPVDGINVENSGSATALTADGLYDLVYSLDAQYLANAVFVGTKGTFKAVRKLKDSENNYLWERSLAKGQPPLLLGHELFMNEAMPAISPNSHPLIIGDMKGYVIADRVGMTVERIEDTTTMDRNKVAIYGRRRLGGRVAEAYKFAAQKVSS